MTSVFLLFFENNKMGILFKHPYNLLFPFTSTIATNLYLEITGTFAASGTSRRFAVLFVLVSAANEKHTVPDYQCKYKNICYHITYLLSLQT